MKLKFKLPRLGKTKRVPVSPPAGYLALGDKIHADKEETPVVRRTKGEGRLTDHGKFPESVDSRKSLDSAPKLTVRLIDHGKEAQPAPAPPVTARSPTSSGLIDHGKAS